MFCYASSAVNGGAKAGISTSSLSTDFIISVPDGANNAWTAEMSPTLKAYIFEDLFGIHHQQEADLTGYVRIFCLFNLPTVDLKDE